MAISRGSLSSLTLNEENKQTFVILENEKLPPPVHFAGFVVVLRGLVDVAAEHLSSMETFETARNNICFQIERYFYSCSFYIPC